MAQVIPHVIRFGIPSIDSLFGDSQAGEDGIYLPQAPGAASPISVSICITGPGGTGKSILGMHLASRYLADCRRIGDVAVQAFYVSTDLKYEVANSVWRRFDLLHPGRRVIPFAGQSGRGVEAPSSIDLLPCHPLRSPEEEEERVAPLSRYLVQAETRAPAVFFVDLASHTAGDDWGYVSRVLSVIERGGGSLPHLMILDSVEGFETLVGERDAFGESQTRRSRVAQILRAAGDKCHIVFIVEEPKEGEHLPEEFVTDVVIRLRSVAFRDYGRRTIEIEKSRGQAHVRGQHILLIRSGGGSTTGTRVNHDDPELPLVSHDSRQSYVHVCPSLHNLNRRIMTLRGPGRAKEEIPRYAAFGIRYLDDMLLPSKLDDFKRDDQGNDHRGLPCGTTTALIGNSQTQKSPLGYAFLSRCFRSYAAEFARHIRELAGSPSEARRILGGAEALVSGSQALELDDEWRRTIFNRFGVLKFGDALTAAALRLGPPRAERDGIPVLLTTNDLHAEILVKKFMPWLVRKVPFLADSPEYEAALEVLMVERSICRRLEIHDMPSAVLIHIMQRSIEAAQSFLFKGGLPALAPERFKRSWGIRVVIDDLSILRKTYGEIRDDPLLLRCLVFLLGREGVTSLLIDTQEGHPHLTVPGPLDSELRILVSGHIYTWRFPFYDGNRVAIAAIPSMRPQTATVIRELREGPGRVNGPEAAPLVVDPHFELYKGIETGQPKPIPLVVYLYEELPAFASYITEQNARYQDLFTQRDDGGTQEMIIGVPAVEYQRLCDLASTQKNTLLEHVLVFQVDEFWSMKRPGIGRSGAARPVWGYLNAKTMVSAPDGKRFERIWAVDTYGVFQQTMLEREDERRTDGPLPAGAAYALGPADVPEETPLRRVDSFIAHGYSLKDPQAEEVVDRVPFMWDFGFLLCKVIPWEDARNREKELTFLCRAEEIAPEDRRFRTVADVWAEMPLATKERAGRNVRRPSWRVFLEASYQLAKDQTYSTSRPTPAFDLYVSALPGLSCLILEIWASEIFRLTEGDDRRWLVDLVARRTWGAAREGLIDLLTRYQLELFRTWLLLVEVLDLHGLTAAIVENRLRTREPNPSALAVRHWYKTAWDFTQDMEVSDPVVPAGLPGSFSVRGDWFLAVAGGSRSERLADQALDFFNTRSANYERLRRGMGLPVRRIVTDQLRTGIVTLDHGDLQAAEGGVQMTGDGESRPMGGGRRRRVSRVHYENLIRLGGPVEGLTSSSDPALRESFAPDDFHWFWRSRLAHFARHSRIWHDWLYQTIIWWNRMREVDGEDWMNGFERYDRMTKQRSSGEDLRAWEVFQGRCTHLIRELKDAALA